MSVTDPVLSHHEQEHWVAMVNATCFRAWAVQPRYRIETTISN